MSTNVVIDSFGLVVPGQITRKSDKSADTTTLTITGEQAKSMYEALGSIVQFFDLGNDQPAKVPAAGVVETRDDK